MQARIMSSSNTISQYTSNLKIKGVKELERLDISQNNLQQISKRLTHDMPSLEVLNLSFNCISSYGIISSAWFAKNVKLQALDLSSTNASGVCADTFISLTSLEKLNLSRNALEEFDVDLLSTNLSVLRLSDNKLQTLSNKVMEHLETLSQDHALSIDLSDNPLSCDCNNIAFITWIHRNKDNIHFEFVERYTCYSSQSKETLYLQYVIDHIEDLHRE